MSPSCYYRNVIFYTESIIERKKDKKFIVKANLSGLETITISDGQTTGFSSIKKY